MKTSKKTPNKKRKIISCNHSHCFKKSGLKKCDYCKKSFCKGHITPRMSQDYATNIDTHLCKEYEIKTEEDSLRGCKKCGYCKKPFKELPFNCRHCDEIFCGKCRHPEDHDCKKFKREIDLKEQSWQKKAVEIITQKDEPYSKHTSSNNYSSQVNSGNESDSMAFFFIGFIVLIMIAGLFFWFTNFYQSNEPIQIDISALNNNPDSYLGKRILINGITGYDYPDGRTKTLVAIQNSSMGMVFLPLNLEIHELKTGMKYNFEGTFEFDEYYYLNVAQSQSIGSDLDYFIEEDILQENKNFENQIDKRYLHFNTKNITYSMDGLDAPAKRRRMRNAFNELSEEVGEFVFTEINNPSEANIKINFPTANNLEIVGEASPEYYSDGEITGGEIIIVKIEDSDCNYHGTELHEILHIFGFDHKSKGIMDMYAGKCYTLKSHSPEYIEHLKFIYSGGLRGVEHPEIPMYENGNYDSMYDAEDYFEYYCEDGLYPTIDNQYCCPEPNMVIDFWGDCS